MTFVIRMALREIRSSWQRLLFFFVCIAIGVASIIANAVPEWVFADMGILCAGGVSSGIYPTDSSVQVEYLINDSSTRVIFAEDEEQLDKILSCRSRCPTLQKIVVNCGVGEAVKQPRLLDVVVEELALITGQRPVRRKAKKSIANYGLREGQEIGASVTLRGAKMWEFLDRFVTVAAPRIRDFRGLNTKSFDGRGNYTLGIKEQLIFPEINYDMVEQMHGMDITFVTTARKDEHAFALLHKLGMPFKGDDKPVTPRVAQLAEAAA